MPDSFDTARRNFLKNAMLSAAAVSTAGYGLAAARPAAAQTAQAEDGHAHDYVNDVADVDHARYDEGQLCENCVFWTGEETNGWGGCQHPDFANVLVNAQGWCSAYAPAG